VKPPTEFTMMLEPYNRERVHEQVTDPQHTHVFQGFEQVALRWSPCSIRFAISCAIEMLVCPLASVL